MIPLVLVALSLSALGAEELSGTWGLVLEVPVTSKFPMVGKVDTTYQSLHLVTFEKDGAATLQTERTCAVRINEDMRMFDVHISPRAVRSLPETKSAVDLVETSGRLRYRATLAERNLGLSGEARALPKTPDDGGVLDGDADGRPGLTLAIATPVGVVDVFFVQRDQAELDGEMRSADLIEGRVVVLQLEQRVIGTDPAVMTHDLHTVARDGLARFALFRLEGEATCHELKGAWASRLERARALASEERGGVFSSEIWAGP